MKIIYMADAIRKGPTMTDVKAAAQRMAEIVRKQEADLIFDHFTPEDAWQLGQIIRQNAMKAEASLSIDITACGLQLFHCAAGQPAPNNESWVRRKRNAVLEFWKSSLLTAKEMLISGRTLQDFGHSEMDFALSGGGFPIRVKGVGFVGAVVVSGLPQLQDHQLIVDSIAEYLKVEVPSVL